MGAACCSSDTALTSFARSHLDERFGVGTADALQRISELVVRAEIKLGTSSLSTPMMLGLGMVLKQVDQDQRHRRPPTSGMPFEDAKILGRAARYARYASAANFEHRLAISDHVGSLAPEAVKLVRSSSMLGCPAYFIAVDHDFDDIVLCIAGPPGGAAEALAEAVAPKEPLLGGRAHAGMLESAMSVVDSACPILLELSQEAPRRGLAIVGHSVGAGIAALTTVLLSAEGCPFAKLMAAGKVKCYSFSPPPTFEPLWALPAWVHGSTYSFVYNMDCVPRACLGTAAKLYWALKQVDKLSMSSERRLMYLRGECELDTVLPDHMEVPQNMSASVGSLFLIGTIISLYRTKDEDEPIRCETVAPHMMDRILLHPDMVHDHSISNFEKVFDDLRAQRGSTDGCVVS